MGEQLFREIQESEALYGNEPTLETVMLRELMGDPEAGLPNYSVILGRLKGTPGQLQSDGILTVTQQLSEMTGKQVLTAAVVLDTNSEIASLGKAGITATYRPHSMQTDIATPYYLLHYKPMWWRRPFKPNVAHLVRIEEHNNTTYPGSFASTFERKVNKVRRLQLNPHFYPPTIDWKQSLQYVLDATRHDDNGAFMLNSALFIRA